MGTLQRDFSSQLGVVVRAQGLAGLSGVQPRKLQFLLCSDYYSSKRSTKQDLDLVIEVDGG